MTPLLPIVVGVLALALGVAILRSFGMRFRVGQILAVAPVVSIAEARAFAEGPPRYVAIQGRIDAADEFEDEAHRPLVLRRVRIQLGSRRGWRTIDEQREAVDFEVREGLDGIAIDQRALDDGLVVLPRESAGTVADAPDRAPAGTPRIDAAATADRTGVLGRTCDRGGRTGHRPGRRHRPHDRRSRPAAHPHDPRTRRGDARPRGGCAASTVLRGHRDGRSARSASRSGSYGRSLGAVTGSALAASPGPSAVVGGDPRSSGQGPGLVGDPLTAIVLVLVIGVGAALATAVYVRMTGGRRT